MHKPNRIAPHQRITPNNEWVVEGAEAGREFDDYDAAIAFVETNTTPSFTRSGFDLEQSTVLKDMRASGGNKRIFLAKQGALPFRNKTIAIQLSGAMYGDSDNLTSLNCFPAIGFAKTDVTFTALTAGYTAPLDSIHIMPFSGGKSANLHASINHIINVEVPDREEDDLLIFTGFVFDAHANIWTKGKIDLSTYAMLGQRKIAWYET